MNAAPPTTLMQTRRLIGADRRRLEQHFGQGGSLPHRLCCCLPPGFQALLWHRPARWRFVNGWKNAAPPAFGPGGAA